MKTSTKIYLGNLLLLILITIYTRIEHQALDILLHAFALVFYVFLNLLFALIFYISSQSHLSKYFLLSAGLGLLIGSSTCFAIDFLRG